jgi:hypothetical protein
MDKKLVEKIIIGIDFAENSDKPTYTVMIKNEDKYDLIDVGKIEDFSFEKFINGGREVHIVGEKRDLEMFKKKMVKGEDKLIDITL